MPKNMSNNESENDSHSKVKEQPAELLSNASADELKQQLGEVELKANQYWERILRMEAEQKNLARRHERDVEGAHKYALEKFVNELLPIVDSLELCITTVPKDLEKAAHSIVDGVSLTLKMFYSALEKFGVKQVNPVGEIFNPEFEQAISMKSDPNVEPNTVLSVLQKGYTLNNRLVRPALVVVSKVEEE